VHVVHVVHLVGFHLDRLSSVVSRRPVASCPGRDSTIRRGTTPNIATLDAEQSAFWTAIVSAQ